ncbi:acetyl-CoA carboxylase biotin carboxyl carrier protein [Pleomorphovibrio marinus]|uniref:acetyl-CoA carboxylase biotin carboxyl carrier protein n=1 Tax=Pleomorphovibrio marinus TaxID=2164132 RepID=UPI000E0C4536|nr:acetyl-CoA carboxylase biotin carboxyl carrier protein [Pleomorphovibrio marinus]
MKPKEIQELIDFISHSGLAEVKIETDEFKLSIKKSADNSAPKNVDQVAAPAPQPAAQQTPPATSPPPATENEPQSSAKGKLAEIKSPMIGTFYRSSNPETDSFVNVGDTVKAGQTVCIIEAMKLFNEIDSEVSGKIVKVLVENASPVEYDQPLFLVEVAD